MNRGEQGVGKDRGEASRVAPRMLMEQAWGAGPGKGDCAVVASRPGLGKTALLVQVAMGDLMAGRKVLHVGVGQSTEHVQSWYDGLFDELCRSSVYHDGDHHKLVEMRHIRTYGHGGLRAEHLRHDLDMLASDAGFRPDTVILDGFRAPEPEPDEMKQFVDLADRLGFALWMAVAVAVPSGESVPKTQVKQSRALEALPAHLAEVTAIRVGLEPCSDGVCVVAVPHSGGGEHLFLEPDTLLVSRV